MIFFDVTKTAAASHRSGLTRVTTRLREELGATVTPIAWDANRRAFKSPPPGPARADDWFLTAELFSEEERPGFSAFLESRTCRAAAIFHDAIPLKHPHITWPQSVARHPAYMKLLAQFDRVWAVSHTSRDELLGFWRWQGIERPPRVDVLALGADFNRSPRITDAAPDRSSDAPHLLCIGIIEPRKNQAFLLEVCESLWREGTVFHLHVVGRVNPHFGPPIVAQIKALRRTRAAWLHFHEAADDALVSRLYASARATVFPTTAEGCGLPLLESLWMGVPCVCSDLPVLRENATGGGCVSVPTNDPAGWKQALRLILNDHAQHLRLAHEARSRPLATWFDAAHMLTSALA